MLRNKTFWFSKVSTLCSVHRLPEAVLSGTRKYVVLAVKSLPHREHDINDQDKNLIWLTSGREEATAVPGLFPLLGTFLR